MSAPLTASAIATAFQGACLAELDALKPGNVHRFGNDQSNANGVADFEASAAAAAPIMGMDGLTVGERIEKAVAATREVVEHNTNLGIVLLAAPLAQAAFKGAGNDLPHSVIKVL
ncbi:MAG: triphosphoribosyl-dephospho-CoA synthase, partial [Pseudomonadota bacterium]